MRISVIIPVFNCENYIKGCLDSVCKQSMKDLEIICIDDGSTDQSHNIIEKYSEKDPRIKLITQSNQGAGKARNAGLKEAGGKFVIFLDGDDYYLDQFALEKMYNLCILKKVKVCGSNLKLMRQGNLSDDTTLWKIRIASREKSVLSYREFQFDYGYTGFLFERNLLIENKIEFPDYRRFQDPPFLVKAMYAAGNFAFSEVGLYCYRVPTMASRYDRSKVEGLLKGLKDNLLFAYEHSLNILFETTLMRLEYEYYSVICHMADENIIQLLWSINQIVQKKLNQDDYVVRPLAFLKTGNNLENYEKALQEKISHSSGIYIYGAGEMSRTFIKYLKKIGLLHKIRGIFVSEGREGKDSFEGFEVNSINKLEKNIDLPIFIATGAVFHCEIINGIKEKGIFNYYTIDSIFLEKMNEEFM